MHLSPEHLSAYLDGEITPAEAHKASGHLRDCAECSQALAAYSGLDGLIAAPPALACAAAQPFLSAELDGELDREESAIAAAHRASCRSCRVQVQKWARADDLVAALPPSRPAARVDAAIAGLGRKPVSRVPRLGGAWAVPTMALATALSLIVVLSLPSGGPTASQTQDLGALYLASAQQSGLDTSTGTLYVLKATLVVLDSSNKPVTEIDASLGKVTSSTTVAVAGTPTALQVDTKGNFVVTSVPAAPGSTTGVISTFSGDSKALESVKQVDVAPQIIVPEPNGNRALFVAPSATTIVDGATYAPLGTAPGGVAAAWSATSDNFAILANGASGATVTYARGGGTILVGGTPHAITALPGGGFAVLADAGSRGVITVINPNSPLATIDAPANGRNLAYDASTHQFSVIGASGAVANVTLPSSLTIATGPTTSGPPAKTSSPLPTAVATATPSGSPTPTPAPSAAPVVVAPREKDSIVPTGARQLWAGTYLVTVDASQRPTRAASDGKRIWYLDQSNRITLLRTDSGELVQVGALPRGAIVSSITVSPNHVYFMDAAASSLYSFTISTEQVVRVPLNLGSNVAAVAASPDERLWIATAATGLVSYEPRSGLLERISIGAGLAVVATDSLGRVWTAAKDRQALDMYDPLTRKVSEFSLAVGGGITALAVDKANTVWVGTDTGQAFAFRSALAASTGTASVSTTEMGRPISGFALDPGGPLYFVSRTGVGVFYATVQFPSGLHVTGSELSEPMFDSLGRAWQADP